MKRLLLPFVAALLLGPSLLALGQQTPPAAKEAYAPGLGEFMIQTQVRHHKLWLAGSAANWELADYEIDELKEGLEDLTKLLPVYKDIQVGRMVASIMTAPIAAVETAIKGRDRGKFNAAFDKLSGACNDCHAASNRGFIVIQRPGPGQFSNQSFAPRPR